jgi:putative DNA primase/helicase
MGRGVRVPGQDRLSVADGAAGDVALAERFLAAQGSRFRYFAAARRWLVYEAGVWRDDPDRVEAREAAERTARDLLRDAADERDPERAKRLLSLGQRAMTAGRLTAMLDVAEPHIALAADDLDRDPWLLGCRNGVVDLRTSDLLAHDPGHLLTRQATAAYHADADAPRWSAFLDRVLPDPDVREFAARLVGMALVGRQRDHVLPILHGTGANGKTTFVEAVASALGTYAAKVQTDVLIGRHERGGATPELLRLRGQRLVVADEPDAGGRLREATVKALTGGDTVVARGLYADPVEFTPTHTLALVTNHRPDVQGGDEGVWRRLLLVPFVVGIPRDEWDLDLPLRLAAEADGILGWAVAGCRSYQNRGLDPPAQVRAATDAYRSEQDHLAEFVADECVVSPDVRVTNGQLRHAYEQWCTSNGVEPLTATALGTRLTDRGWPGKVSGSTRYRCGIALRAPEQTTRKDVP